MDDAGVALNTCRSYGLVHLSQDFFQQFLMMSGHDDMVVANRFAQEVIGLALVVQHDDLLRPAEVCFSLVAH